MFRLQGGEASLLVTEDLYQRITRETNTNNRFLTAYQFASDGQRLGRVHVRAMQSCSPGAISSCSQLLLSERVRIHELFAYLAETCPEKVFTRFVTPEGVMVPIEESGLHPQDYADSFMNVLGELEHLLFSDAAIETRGGACYQGMMGPIATMLAQFWKTDRCDRYDISGPDMIRYATPPCYQESLAQMLRHIRCWKPELVPRHIAGHMFDGTVARFGYIPGHISEQVLSRKVQALTSHQQHTNEEKRAAVAAATHDGKLWPNRINPELDPYFSQHDLAALGSHIVVDEYWKTVPFSEMHATLARANGLLRIQ